MKKIHCALCQKESPYQILFKENLDLKNINEKVFSARRIPDGYHYQVVRCQRCGLVFSNPILEEEKIKTLYSKSKLTYASEIKNLRKTYGHYLKKSELFLPSKERLLEIGCGEGFFLIEALKQGFKEVYGIEPSEDAVEKSLPKVRKNIINDFFQPGLFKANYFDVICFFQTLDHVINPNLFLKTCYKILKKNGIVFCITHNTDSIFTKILGEKSPIFDIEHVYLFNKKTLRQIFKKNKFRIIGVFDIANEYSLDYWVKMSPLSRKTKRLIKKASILLNFDKITLKLKVGNIGILAKKM